MNNLINIIPTWDSIKHLLLGLTSMVFFCGALGLVMPQSAEAKKTCKTPPAWDQKITKNRFIPAFGAKNENAEAFCDRETGLVWEREPDTSEHRWDNAINHCDNRIVGGRKGWYLPRREQLASLVDPGNLNPTLPAGHPFRIVNRNYWTATTASFNPEVARYVSFSDGLVLNGFKTLTSSFRAWCVRGD